MGNKSVDLNVDAHEDPQEDEAQTADRHAYEVLFEGKGDVIELWNNAPNDQLEQFYEEALETCLEELSWDNWRTEEICETLAGLYTRNGKAENAIALRRRILAVAEEISGNSHPNLLGPLHHLAFLYWSLRKYDEAEEALNRSLDICQSAESLTEKEMESSLAGIMSSLVWVYNGQGRVHEAKALCERVIEMKARLYGRDSDHVTVELTMLSGLSGELGDCIW